MGSLGEARQPSASRYWGWVNAGFQHSPLTHLAMAFAIAPPGVTSAIIGPRTTGQHDDLLAGMDVVLSDDVLDRIDEIVAPGTSLGPPDESAYVAPALRAVVHRQRTLEDRAAA